MRPRPPRRMWLPRPWPFPGTFPMEPAPAPAAFAVDLATAVKVQAGASRVASRSDGPRYRKPRHAVLGAPGPRDAVLGLALGLGGSRGPASQRATTSADGHRPSSPPPLPARAMFHHSQAAH